MKLTRTSAEMVAAAKARIREIPASEAVALAGDQNVVIVDIRDIRERQRHGFIPGSVHAPRGMVEFWVDPDSDYHKPVFDQPGKTYLFHCAAGWRSALMVATLADMGFEGAAHITEGFEGWVAAGGPVQMPEPRK